jgi:hypothetical protein
MAVVIVAGEGWWSNLELAHFAYFQMLPRIDLYCKTWRDRQNSLNFSYTVMYRINPLQHYL